MDSAKRHPVIWQRDTIRCNLLEISSGVVCLGKIAELSRPQVEIVVDQQTDTLIQDVLQQLSGFSSFVRSEVDATVQVDCAFDEERKCSCLKGSHFFAQKSNLSSKGDLIEAGTVVVPLKVVHLLAPGSAVPSCYRGEAPRRDQDGYRNPNAAPA